MTNDDPRYAIISNADIADSASIYDHVNLYGCEIGPGTKIDAFVYIEEEVVVGRDCILRPFVFVPTGIEIGDEVFIGPHVTFTNDPTPSISRDWELHETVVKSEAAIGAGATILPGVTIGRGAMVGAGALVTKNVSPGSTVAGNPARVIE
jgi:acetyltransferase-like isoleucine patch superfamily enzyme